jgi:hypothetical protein
MRRPRALSVFALMLLFVAACGSPAASDGNGDGNGNDSEQSEPAEESQGDGGGDGGGGGGGGGGDRDGEAAFDTLTPPNADEVTKTTAEGVIFAAFNTPDSLDSLTSFYEDAFNDLGLQILSTTEASGGITWFVGTDENASTFGGVVSVFPSSDGGGGNTVSIQIGQTST